MDSFDELCRLCRTPNDRTELWPHLFHQDEQFCFLEKIHACTSVRIREDDRLPKRICIRCQAALDQAYIFRMQCEEVNARWLLEIELLDKGNDPPPPVVKVDLDTAIPSVASVYVKPELEDEDEYEEGDHMGLVELLQVESKEDSEQELVNDEGSGGDEQDESDEPDEDEKPVRKKRGPKPSEPKPKTRFHCSLCPRHFARKCRLREHELRHSGIKNFECETCHNKFYSETDLRTHIARQHATELPFICEKCGQGFSSKGQRTNHYNTHLESREFACDVCSKSFKTKYILKAHMEFHLPKELRKDCYKYKKPTANNKTYVCPYCGKVSTSSGVHNKHIRIHTGDQRYECSICQKKFTASFSLISHMRTHTDERPYRCEYCQKAFRLRNHMKNHVRSAHTNERPFQCKYCTRTFVTRGNMRLHERIHGEPASAPAKTGVDLSQARLE